MFKSMTSLHFIMQIYMLRDAAQIERDDRIQSSEASTWFARAKCEEVTLVHIPLKTDFNRVEDNHVVDYDEITA